METPVTMNAEKLDAVFISRPAMIVIIERKSPPPPIPPALEIEAAKKERTAAIIVGMENSIVDLFRFGGKWSHWLVVLRILFSSAMADGLKMMRMVIRERSTGTKLIIIFLIYGAICNFSKVLGFFFVWNVRILMRIID